MEISTLAKLLKPYIYSYIEETLTATSIGASGSSTDITAAFNAHVADTNIHHNRQHSIISPTDHSVVGNPLDLIGLVNTNQLGIIVPSSNPGAASAILRTDSSGYVAVRKLSTNTIDTTSGNITINPAGAGVVYISADVGIGKSSPDYALDVVGTGKFSIEVITQYIEYGSSQISLAGGNFTYTGSDANLALTYGFGIDAGQSDVIYISRNDDVAITHTYNIGINKTASADYMWLGYSSSVGLRQFADGDTVIQTKLTIGASEPDESYPLSVTGITYTTTGFVTPGYVVAASHVKTNYVYDADDITIGSTTGSVRLEDDKAFLTETFDSSFPQTGFRIGPTSISGQYSVSAGVGLFDELRVRIFVADETRVDRGNQYWTKSFGIVADEFTTPGAINGTVTVKFEDSPALSGAIFSANDWILFQVLDIDTGITLSSVWGQVTSYADLSGSDEGKQSWTFTLKSGPTSQKIRKGQSAIDFGATGAALIHLSTVDPNGSPYIKMRRWTGANPYTPANFHTYIQLGYLSSISNPNYSPSGYGLYIESESGNSSFLVADANGVRLQNLSIKAFSTNQTVDLASTGNLKLGTNIANATTTSFDFTASSGALRVGFLGSGKPNLYFDGTNVYLRINTTSFIELQSSGSAYISGILNIGSSGGIYQGTGTFASPTTGLKIWNDSSIGRFATYNSGTTQIYLATDGRLYAGGGGVALDSRGIHSSSNGTAQGIKIYTGTPFTDDTYRELWLYTLSGELHGPSYIRAGHHTDFGDASSTYTTLKIQVATTSNIVELSINGSSQTIDTTIGGSVRSSISSSALTLSVDLDMDGNDIVDIGILGEAFTAASLTFNTGWGNFGGSTGSVQYRKVGDLVFLRGLAARTSGSATVIATLPVGYRPPATYYFGTTSNSGDASCYINSSGQIVWVSGGVTWFSLSGIFFGT